MPRFPAAAPYPPVREQAVVPGGRGSQGVAELLQVGDETAEAAVQSAANSPIWGMRAYCQA
jgi:hypothetical protein